MKEQFYYDKEEMQALFDESVEASNVTPESDKWETPKIKDTIQKTTTKNPLVI